MLFEGSFNMSKSTRNNKPKFTESFEYELSYALDYAFDGEMRQGSKLVVFAPSYKIGQYAALIEQEFSKAMFEFSKTLANMPQQDGATETQQSTKRIESTEMSAQELQAIITMLFSSADIDKCFVALQKILTFEQSGKAMCLVDGLEKLTVPLMEQLKYVDIKNILALYIENFINTSQLV
jgi:hypothetical protein